MNPRYCFIRSSVSALVMAGAALLPMAAPAQNAEVEDVQTLTRGPVHEAFAGTISFDPVPGVIVIALAIWVLDAVDGLVRTRQSATT